jgi:hypothetical protein
LPFLFTTIKKNNIYARNELCERRQMVTDFEAQIYNQNQIIAAKNENHNRFSKLCEYFSILSAMEILISGC